MLLGAAARPAGRGPARSSGQLAGPSATCSATRHPGSPHNRRPRRRSPGAGGAALPSSPLEHLPPETGRDREQRLAADDAQARQCALLAQHVAAAAAAAGAPQAAAAARDKALRPWVSAAAGAGPEAAEQLACLRAEAEAVTGTLAKALCGDAPLGDGALASGWDSLFTLQHSWATAFPACSATGLATDVMAALLDSLVVGRARRAGQSASRQAQQAAAGVAALRAQTAARGTTVLLRPSAHLQLESELTCVEWAAAAAARERAWADGRCAALEADAARWQAAAEQAMGRGSAREAAEAVACMQVCKTSAQRLTAGSMALSTGRSALADSRAALQLMAAEARMAAGLSELSRLRVAVTAALAALGQDGPRAAGSGALAPTLCLRMRDVAAAAARGAVALQEMREVVVSGRGGPEAASHLAAADAKAAAAAEMLGQLAACLAASTGVEWAAREE